MTTAETKLPYPKKQALLKRRCNPGQTGAVESEEPEPAWPQRPFRRGWRFNWPGVILMAIYCLAFVFYLYIRIRYTLDLGAYVWRAPYPSLGLLHP